MLGQQQKFELVLWQHQQLEFVLGLEQQLLLWLEQGVKLVLDY